jgi:hypothetical protein
MPRKKAAARTRRAPRAKRAASPPQPPPIHAQLKSTFARLRKSHPNLIGIGLGYQRSGPDQTTQPVVSVRLIVEKKPKRRGHVPAGQKRLPKHVYLRTLALGHPVRVRVPTDVEGAPQAAQSSGFRIYKLRAAAFVTWKEGGVLKAGVLTAAHAFDTIGKRVGVQGKDNKSYAGTVRAISDWRVNGVDCAIVEIDRADQLIVDAGPALPGPLPAIDDLILALGDAKDAFACPARFWGFPDERPISAVAYYAKFPMNYLDGTQVILTDVVECTSATAAFSKGQSGSLWSVQLTPGKDSSLAIQSHMVDDGERAFGCICATVQEKIREILNDPDAHVFLTVDDLRAST